MGVIVGTVKGNREVVLLIQMRNFLIQFYETYILYAFFSKLINNMENMQFIKKIMTHYSRFYSRATELNIIYQGDWTNTEIQVKYEKLKLHDLFNKSMEVVFQKNQKWGI